MIKTTSIAVLLLGLAGCATTTTEEQKTIDPSQERIERAKTDFEQAFQALPPCAAGAEVGLLELVGTCTEMFCKAECCNGCSWTATLQTKNGVKQPVDAARVSQVLKLKDNPKDCELKLWRAELAKRSLALEGTACRAP